VQTSEFQRPDLPGGYFTKRNRKSGKVQQQQHEAATGQQECRVENDAEGLGCTLCEGCVAVMFFILYTHIVFGQDVALIPFRKLLEVHRACSLPSSL